MTRTPKIKAIQLVGQSKQAPGLKTRQSDILHKALGLAQETPVHPMALSALAAYHPDPKVQKAAAASLGKLAFKLNPTAK